jgi:esterase/lipase
LRIAPGRIPLQYAFVMCRNRQQLRELQLLEMTVEAEYELAKLEASGAESPEVAEERMSKADAAYEEGVAEFRKFRAELPTDLRKLTAGCNTPLRLKPWLS